MRFALAIKLYERPAYVLDELILGLVNNSILVEGPIRNRKSVLDFVPS